MRTEQGERGGGHRAGAGDTGDSGRAARTHTHNTHRVWKPTVCKYKGDIPGTFQSSLKRLDTPLAFLTASHRRPASRRCSRREWPAAGARGALRPQLGLRAGGRGRAGHSSEKPLGGRNVLLGGGR